MATSASSTGKGGAVVPNKQEDLLSEIVPLHEASSRSILDLACTPPEVGLGAPFYIRGHAFATPIVTSHRDPAATPNFRPQQRNDALDAWAHEWMLGVERERESRRLPAAGVGAASSDALEPSFNLGGKGFHLSTSTMNFNSSGYIDTQRTPHGDRSSSTLAGGAPSGAPGLFPPICTTPNTRAAHPSTNTNNGLCAIRSGSSRTLRGDMCQIGGDDPLRLAPMALPRHHSMHVSASPEATDEIDVEGDWDRETMSDICIGHGAGHHHAFVFRNAYEGMNEGLTGFAPHVAAADTAFIQPNITDNGKSTNRHSAVSTDCLLAFDTNPTCETSSSLRFGQLGP